MDMQKIGQFLSQLRREHGLTQEQLGDQLGVTNKTVSRWETGTYLPPVEMLQALSDFYGLTINELLSGERLSEREYQKKAEENIKTVLSQSSFTLRERIVFFKAKWRKEHIADFVMILLGTAALYAAGVILDNGLQIMGLLFCAVSLIVQNNRMMTYVEARAFDGSGRQ